MECVSVDKESEYAEGDVKAIMDAVGAELGALQYESGDYEGNGMAVIWSSKDGYTVIDLCHCSCYGPGENFYYNTEPHFKNIEDIKDMVPQEVYDTIQSLVELTTKW